MSSHRIGPVRVETSATTLRIEPAHPNACAFARHAYLGLLVAVAASGLSFYVFERAIAFMILFFGAMAAATLGGALALFGARGRGVMRRIRRSLVLQSDGDGDAEDGVVLDGDRIADLDDIREIRIGCCTVQGQTSAAEQYPVFLVLERAVVEVATFHLAADALELAAALGEVPGVGAVPVTAGETDNPHFVTGLALGGVLLLEMMCGVWLFSPLTHTSYPLAPLPASVATSAVVAVVSLALHLLAGAWQGSRELARAAQLFDVQVND